MPAPPRSTARADPRPATIDPTRRAGGAARILAAALFALVGSGRAADRPDPAAGPVTALWTALPLRDWAGRATTLAGRPVVVDRRLDPDATVTRDCRGEPLDAMLAAVATTVGGTVEPLRSWIRIAPAAEAGRATRGERDRAAEIAALPAAARAPLAARRPWSWTDGARPRDLLAAAAADAGLTVTGLAAVPHDHLPATALPPLSLAERLDLVLAHYDLRVAWSAAGGTTAAGSVVQLAAAEPRAAGVADRKPPSRPARPPRGPERRTTDRYTLKLEAPLDEALRALGPRLGLEPELDRASLAARGILPGEIARAAVTDATREHLLDAILSPLGLRWRIKDGRLVVDAPPPP